MDREHFGQIRAAISKSRRLTSPQTYQALTAVYESWFMHFDLELTDTARAGLDTHDDARWSDLHARIMTDGFQRIDTALTDLAKELQLTSGGVATC